MPDLSPAARAVADAIRGFRWHNYGLDDVENAEADDWIGDLATAAVNAIRDLEDRQDAEAIRRAEEAHGDGPSFILHTINGMPLLIPEDGAERPQWTVLEADPAERSGGWLTSWTREGAELQKARKEADPGGFEEPYRPGPWAIHRRTVIEWPDGHELTTPWELDEESNDE